MVWGKRCSLDDLHRVLPNGSSPGIRVRSSPDAISSAALAGDTPCPSPVVCASRPSDYSRRSLEADCRFKSHVANTYPPALLVRSAIFYVGEHGTAVATLADSPFPRSITVSTLRALECRFSPCTSCLSVSRRITPYTKGAGGILDVGHDDLRRTLLCGRTLSLA